MNLNINSAWSAASAILKEFSFYDIKEIVGLSGFDTSKISHLVQMSGPGSASKGQLISQIELELKNFNGEEKQHFLNIVIEEMLFRSSNVKEKLEMYLSRLGWQIIDNKVLPIELLDISDLDQLDDIVEKI